MNKYLQWLLCLSVGVFSLVVFTFIYFPYNTLFQNLLRTQVEEPSGGLYRVVVGEINPGVFFKSVFKDVKLIKREGKEDKVLFAAPEVKLGVGYLPLLFNKFKGSYVVKAAKGSMEGSFNFSNDSISLDAQLDQFPLQSFPGLEEYITVPLTGRVGGEIDVAYYPNQLSKNSGEINLEFLDFVIEQKQLVIKGVPLDWPETNLSKVKKGALKATLSKDKLEIKALDLPGEDLVFYAKGRFNLAKQWAATRLNLTGTFALSEKMKNAFPFIAALDSQKQPDGTYPFAISGRIGAPRPRIGTLDLGQYLGY